MTAPILIRECKIEKDGALRKLTISFLRPTPRPGGGFDAVAEISCPFFSQVLRSVGEDEVQALFSLQDPVVAFLRLKVQHDHLSIYWTNPGDLGLRDFWRYSP
jgi:hypothetical protein